MKIFLLLFLVTLSLTSKSQTQLEMNNDANKEYIRSEIELNKVYKKVIEVYQSDTNFILKLKISQKLWLSLRNAEIEMKYPAQDKRLNYGSVNPMCISYQLQYITDNRTEQLRTWLIGSEEGDMCLGSVKMNPYVGLEDIHKCTIQADSTLSLTTPTQKNYRIFGYTEPHLNSKKTFLLSGFSSEVENNPFILKYGAYYDTDSIDQFQLKLKSILGEFIEIELFKNKDIIDTIYIEKIWLNTN